MSIGVVVPTYGRAAKTLDRTLAAMVGAGPVRPQIVVVDQNQGAARAAIHDVAVRHGARYEWLATPNVSNARNVGALTLETDLVAFVDDDVVLEPSALDAAVELFDRRDDIQCLWASVTEARDGEDVQHPEGPPRRMRLIRSDALFFRSESFRRAGGFDPHLFAFAGAVEDHELLTRMTRAGIDVWLAPQVQALHHGYEPGGCELRSVPLSVNEWRCIAGLAYTERARGGGRIGLPGTYRLTRSFLVNGGMLRRPIGATYRRLLQFRRAVAESRLAMAPYLPVYVDPSSADHLTAVEPCLGS